MDTKIDKLIELSYELEGLLLLARNREENMQQFVSYAKKKFNSIEETFAELETIIQSHDNTVDDIVELGELNKSESIATSIEPVNSEDPAIDDFSINTPKTTIVDCMEEELEDKNVSAPVDTRNIKQCFTINDKFRFRRELFGNSDTDFADTLNLLSAMTSYAEVQDYLLNDLEWDINNDEVAEFLTIIETYFKSRIKG